MNENINLPIKELEKRFKKILPTLAPMAGNEVVNFALDNFKKQGFLNHGFEAWRQRKKSKWGFKDREGRALLVKSGRLRRSIRITNISFLSVTVGSDVPYAKAHNDGLRLGLIQSVKSFTRKKFYTDEVSAPGAKSTKYEKKHVGNVQVSAHTRRIDQKIPARPFLKDSPYLTAKIKRVITAEILKALR